MKKESGCSESTEVILLLRAVYEEGPPHTAAISGGSGSSTERSYAWIQINPAAHPNSITQETCLGGLEDHTCSEYTLGLLRKSFQRVWRVTGTICRKKRKKQDLVTDRVKRLFVSNFFCQGLAKNHQKTRGNNFAGWCFLPTRLYLLPLQWDFFLSCLLS